MALIFIVDIHSIEFIGLRLSKEGAAYGVIVTILISNAHKRKEVNQC